MNAKIKELKGRLKSLTYISVEIKVFIKRLKGK
jgi:hypothetical protein